MTDDGALLRDETPCAIDIASAGLPFRTERLLARERRSFPAMQAGLFSSGKGSVALAPPLTGGALARALASSEPGRAYAAAFLIGRCRARDVSVDTALTRRLEAGARAAAGGSDTGIEAAMSLVLRGELARGTGALRAVLAATPPSDDRYKAAFYLAQIGDPSGYPALVDTLHGAIPHYRLMALRHAAAFVPYDGRTVDGMVVDVRALLVERLSDPDDLVRSEVPFYLEELEVGDLRALLEPVQRTDPSTAVRAAAQMVLERNR